MDMDYGAVFLAMQAAVTTAADPSEAWRAVLTAASEGGAYVADAIRAINIRANVAAIGTQLRKVVAAEPIGAVDFLYFGLYDAYDDRTGGTIPGFYVAGGQGEQPEEAVFEAPLSYRPSTGDLESDALLRIRQAADADEAQRTFYEYALTFGAAAILAKFGARAAGLSLPLVVGFDSGDIVAVS